MLLDLKPPTNMHFKMWREIRFIIKLIEFCEDRNLYDGKYDVNEFSLEYPEISASFLLSVKSTAMKNRVESFFALFPKRIERERILDVIRHDIDFHRLSPMFCFKSFDIKFLSRDTNEKVRNFFANFYEDFFGGKEAGDTINIRGRFKEEYEHVNRDYIYVCPACLGTMELLDAQLDHYFPDSLFPALVIHPHNLVPVCLSCNSSTGTKENRGKANNIPGGKVRFGMLEQLFIPYLNSGYSKVKAEITGTGGFRRARLISMHGASSLVESQVENHSKLYNINRRWTRRLKRLNKELMENVVEQLYSQYEITQSVTKEDVKKCLYNIYRKDVASLFKNGDLLLYACYAKEIQDNEDMFRGFFLEVLCLLGEEYQKRLDKPFQAYLI